MSKKTFLYIRVSSKDQNEARQLAEIKELGIHERDNILQRQAEGIAKAKGKHLGRPQLNLSTISKQQREILELNYEKWKLKELTGVQFSKCLV
ncbi:hypothetical protein J22TS1_21620 [Siminovitchia terrae]|uniref:hypothetical protein n=1 Tax=Siminovitchia terrae TaxID=1914933 RepID=UPI001B143437|nr:hypothetical protein J22TS1_21620 [Siminovitchia terrae]